jgi:hypothetical protein
LATSTRLGIIFFRTLTHEYSIARLSITQIKQKSAALSKPRRYIKR